MELIHTYTIGLYVGMNLSVSSLLLTLYLYKINKIIYILQCYSALILLREMQNATVIIISNWNWHLETVCTKTILKLLFLTC